MDNPKKRKTEPSDNENQPGGSFSCIQISAEELRKQLENPEVLQLIKDYFLQSKDENNVSNYFKAGGSISEICQLLTNMDLKKRDQICVVFSVLQFIIIRSLTESSDQDKLSDECKQIISNYIGEFQSLLTTKTTMKNKKIVLRLLATIATVNAVLAGLILSSLTLTKDDIRNLLEHVTPMDDSSLRVSFIHFILAFTIEQSGKVIEKLLLKKVWLPSIFPGIQFDSPFTIKLVLTTLEGRLVDGKDVSKTSKLYAFNSSSLTHLSELYNWDPKTWFDKKSYTKIDFTGKISEDDKMEIRTLVHGLLMKLCTSVKNGIAFYEPSYLTSSTQQNNTLSNFLQKVERPWDDTLKSELIHQTVIVCPDLLKPILTSFQPRLKVILPNWVEVLKLVIKIIEDIKWDLTDPDPKHYLNIVQELLVPRQILEAISSGQLLKGKNSCEKLTTLKLLLIILDRFNEFSARISKEDNNYATFQKGVMPYLINHLPNCFVLLECLKLSYELKEFDVLKELIKLFILYEQICPEMVDIIRYDDTVSDWIIEYISASESSDSSDISLLLNMVRLETIIKPQDAFQDEYIYRFKYTTMGKEDIDIKLGLDILKELLHRSGIFIRNENELSLWIYCMEKYFDSGIGSIMAASLEWALENTNAVYKTLLQVQEYPTVNNSFGMNLEDVLKLSVNDDGDDLDTSVDSMFNLSPMLPSVLQFLSDSSYTANDDFIVAFIVHYLHRQVTVQPYVALLKNYQCPTVEKIMPYVESWLVEPIHISIPPFSKSLYYHASRSIIAGKTFNCGEIGEELNDVKSRELLLEECIFIACELSKLGLVTSQRLDKISALVRLCLRKSGIQVPLNHPTLLAGFHPIVDAASSDLTDLVIMIAEQCRLPPKVIAPFSHRLAFEIKYDKKTCYNLEDNSKLQKLLQIFKFSKSDVEDLMDYVFSMKAKYFERRGKLSQWSMMLTYLLTEAVDRNILMTESSLENLINIVIKLIEKGYNTYEMCDKIFKYLKIFEVELSGTLLDSARDLFAALSTAPVWHEDLCIYIYLLIGKVDYGNISLERSITLLASLEKFKKRHKEVVSDASRVIFNGLCERPSPKWLVDLQKLINPALSAECCQKTCKLIKKHPTDIFISIEALSVIKDVFKKCEETYTLYTLVTDWLSEEIQNSKDSFNQAQSEEMCRILCEILTSDIDLSAISSAQNDFIMRLLLEGLRLPSHPILELLLCFVEKNLTKLPPTEIFQLLTSHSCFLDVLMEQNSSAKCSCLKIMLALIKKDDSLINSQHVPTLLSSYRGTLSKMDQINLKILRIYETVGGMNLAAGWKPHVWGEAARDHYSVRSKLATARPSATATLDLLDKDIVARTISAYPLHRTLHDDGEIYEEDDKMYDPAFYLPLMSQVTVEKNIAWKMASSGALALILSSLASADPLIRTAAYHVLHRLYSNTDNHKDNLIWKHFIEALRGGIFDLKEKDNVRLSSIVTTFLARASMIMAIPDDPLYFSLHNFIFAKPHLKLNTIPAFLEMFHHTRGNQKLHQRWLLEVIRDGIRERRDLQLTLNCLMFKFIVDFHSCCLATLKTKLLIEEIVVKSIAMDEKQLLVNNYSIIPWLNNAKSAIMKNLPLKINAQYKPLVDFVKERLVKN